MEDAADRSQRLGQLSVNREWLRILSQPVHSVRSDRLLTGMKAAPGRQHLFWADNISLCDGYLIHADGVVEPKQITDVYLAALALRNSGRLVTFDTAVAWAAIAAAAADLICILLCDFAGMTPGRATDLGISIGGGLLIDVSYDDLRTPGEMKRAEAVGEQGRRCWFELLVGTFRGNTDRRHRTSRRGRPRTRTSSESGVWQARWWRKRISETRWDPSASTLEIEDELAWQWRWERSRIAREFTKLGHEAIVADTKHGTESSKGL